MGLRHCQSQYTQGQDGTVVLIRPQPRLTAIYSHLEDVMDDTISTTAFQLIGRVQPRCRMLCSTGLISVLLGVPRLMQTPAHQSHDDGSCIVSALIRMRVQQQQQQHLMIVCPGNFARWPAAALGPISFGFESLRSRPHASTGELISSFMEACSLMEASKGSTRLISCSFRDANTG
jgi:hypothetical protein